MKHLISFTCGASLTAAAAHFAQPNLITLAVIGSVLCGLAILYSIFGEEV